MAGLMLERWATEVNRILFKRAVVAWLAVLAISLSLAYWLPDLAGAVILVGFAVLSGRFWTFIFPGGGRRLTDWYAQADEEQREKRGYLYRHTLHGWSLGARLTVQFGIVAFFTGVVAFDLLARRAWLAGAALLVFGLIAGLSYDVRMVVTGREASVALEAWLSFLCLSRKVIRYERIVDCQPCDRPWWYFLGILWYSAESSWNLTDSRMVAIATADRKRHLVATGEPEVLCRFLEERRMAARR